MWRNRKWKCDGMKIKNVKEFTVMSMRAYMKNYKD